eukprot:6471770-Amphidinium_carterae.2
MGRGWRWRLRGALAVLVVLLEVDVVELEVDELVALTVELEVVVVELEVDALEVLAVECEVAEVELVEVEELLVLQVQWLMQLLSPRVHSGLCFGSQGGLSAFASYPRGDLLPLYGLTAVGASKLFALFIFHGLAVHQGLVSLRMTCG